MANYKCTEVLYRAFLQASSIRYSSLALSEVSPTELSHDSISRWLRSKRLRPAKVWKEAELHINKESPCLLIADDTVLSKQYSKKIELVHYQYSSSKRDIIAMLHDKQIVKL